MPLSGLQVSSLASSSQKSLSMAFGPSKSQSDGTTITHSISNRDFPPIVTTSLENNKPRSSRNVHAPRTVWPDGDCWAYTLDHAGVDQSANDLANWAGNGGHDLCAPSGSTFYYFYNNRATIVYYCIDAPGRCGNIDRNDVRYALGQMDAHCPPYQASWFKWPQSYEIIGKSRFGDDVCVGH
ncbi:hypothetical protein IFR05_011726 [Cadophora sp. M221]|nr:hypothetical protein IFR05_011726 [Cadophora sp. M221]